jgi:hypothetical protein
VFRYVHRCFALSTLWDHGNTVRYRETTMRVGKNTMRGRECTMRGRNINISTPLTQVYKSTGKCEIIQIEIWGRNKQSLWHARARYLYRTTASYFRDITL